MHDRIGKHIAYPFRAIFLNDCFRCILWQTIPVKLFSDCLFNGILASYLSFMLHLFLSLL